MAIEFILKAETKQLERKLNNAINSQIPYALSLALNESAKTMLAKHKQDMNLAFENPTPFTKNAFYIQYAKKHNPVAVIRRKDMQRGKHYLEVQDAGGFRGRKAFETNMRMNLPYDGDISYVTPTRYTPLNRYGNMSQGFLRKIESELRTARDPAMRMNTKKPGARKTKFGYFTPPTSHPLGQGKRAGVYKRSKAGNVTKVLNFTTAAPKYRPRTNFDANMRRYFGQVYQPKFNAALRRALSTMKLR